MAEIQLKNVSKHFKDVVVFEGLTLTIRDGEFFTFLGPSGCGKSTLLNLIAGLEEITDGEILFDGQLVNDLPPRQRDVAMVFQSYALYPHMTVFDNIAFPLKMKKYDKQTIKREVEAVASILGLKGLLNRKPRELSGGQRQRVAFGRAIVRRPRVFLMDEPLSNLDARLRVEMRAELKKLHKELKTTIVYVTHDQAEAMGLSDRIAIINEGMIQQCATPVEIYTRPKNIFVATFVGSPAMNLIEGELLSEAPLRVKAGDLVLSISTEQPPRTDRVIIGIRPEDVEVSTSGETCYAATVELLEPEGARIWIDLIVGNIKIKGYSSIGTSISPGQRVYLNIPVERVHVFDPVTKQRL